jgi:hypothetical protein
MKALGLLLGAGVAALAAGQANATIYLGLQTASVNGGMLTQVASDSGSGQLGYTGTYGDFINNISVQGFPVLDQPQLQTGAINSQKAAGVASTLTIYVTQTGLSAISGALTSSFTANLFQDAAKSVTLSTLIDPTNGIFSGNLLASQTFTTLGSKAYATAVSGLTGPFSETTKYEITFGAGKASVNDTINISAGAVPEPASWALMLAGFGFMGYALRQRRRPGVTFA